MDSMHSQSKPPFYSLEKQKNSLKVHMDIEKTLESQNYYTRRMTIVHLMSYYRAVVIKSMVLAQNRHIIDQQNRLEHSEGPDTCL